MMPLTADLVAEFTQRGLTVATAESLTAGLVSAGIAEIPGASSVLRGGAVTYATACKASVLGVQESLLAQRGAVDPAVAEEMAQGARRVFSADIGVATTGVAGPSEQDGQPIGTVFISVAGLGESPEESERCHTRRFRFAGSRDEIRQSSAEAAWQLCIQFVRDDIITQD